MLEIGKAVRIVRQAKGLKLNQLAQAAGISVPFLSLVENGGRQPSLDVVRRLAAGLGIPSEVLIVLAQPRGGSLQSEDRVARSFADCIRKLADAEAVLRARLDTEVTSE
jgi:transcriptional regulator with XRE-family HTH domain